MGEGEGGKREKEELRKSRASWRRYLREVRVACWGMGWLSSLSSSKIWCAVKDKKIIIKKIYIYKKG
jgi:hypothetical protein